MYRFFHEKQNANRCTVCLFFFSFAKWLSFFSIFYFSIADDEDDLISISNASDFVVFKESGFNRLYVAAVNNDLVEQSGNKISVATLRAKSSAERYRTSSLEYSTGYCIGENTVDQDMPYKLRFAVGKKHLYCFAFDDSWLGDIQIVILN